MHISLSNSQAQPHTVFTAHVVAHQTKDFLMKLLDFLERIVCRIEGRSSYKTDLSLVFGRTSVGRYWSLKDRF
jgi:hypothetical protein